MSLENSGSDFHVLIIGAGSVGLLLAQRLKALNISCTVYEREDFLNARGRNWNFGIYWAQAPLSECLPQTLQDEITKAQVNPFSVPSKDATMPILNAESGEVLMRAPTPQVLRLNRARFREMLARGVDIKYGKRLKNITSVDEQDVKSLVIATFEDGTHAKGHLLIGADGAKSIVRGRISGPERGSLITLPLMGIRAISTLPEELSRNLSTHIQAEQVVSIHPVGLIAYISLQNVPDVDRLETWEWLFHLTYPYNAEDAAPQDLRGVWDKYSDKLGPPLHEPFLAAPQHSALLCDRVGHWPTLQWDNWDGRVTLAGDAAHPMTYHRGQGLNNAVHDAAYLSRALSAVCHDGKSLKQEISEYEKEIVKRGHEAVISSTENSLMLTDWGKFTKSPLFQYGVKQGTQTSQSGSDKEKE